MKKSTEIREQIDAGEMPKNAKLSDAEKTRILAFLDCGAPIGGSGIKTQDKEVEVKGTGAYCSACKTDSDCAGGAMCLYSTDGKNALCGKKCKTDAECAADAECFDIEDWDGSKLGRSCYPASGSCATGGTTGKTGTTGATGTTGTNTCTTQTWASVTPSFATYCSGCHQWAKTYTGVQGKGAKISARLNNDSMPPPAKPQPTASEQAAIVEWVDCGLPQ